MAKHACIWAVTALLGLSAAAETNAADKTFRLAVTASPQLKGNAVAGGGVTANFIWAAFYDSLTRINNDGNVTPWLAKAWKPVTDTEWHFTLRPDVRFANGEPFNAAAVKYNFDRLRGDDARSYMRHQDMKTYPRVEIIDDLTVAIHTVEPNAVAPAYLTMLKFAPPKYLDEVGFQGLADKPIGTGPFLVDDWGPEKITARVNPHAWTPPQVDNLELFVVPDATARIQALLTNQVDAALAISTDQIEILEDAGHRVSTRTPHRVYVFALQAEDPASPFSDVRVRRAVNYAVNAEVLTSVLLGGLVEPVSQPALSLTDGFDPSLEPYTHDPDKAKGLLADAGFENGFSFTLETVSNFMPNDAAILQQIQADLTAVGVTMNINVVTYPTILRATLFGEMGGEAMPTDFFNTTGDALRPFLSPLNHACSGAKPWFCDETIQPLIDEARTTMDLDRRNDLTRQVVTYYRDNASSLFLFPVLGLDGLHNRVSRWEPWLDVLNYHLVDVAAAP